MRSPRASVSIAVLALALLCGVAAQEVIDVTEADILLANVTTGDKKPVGRCCVLFPSHAVPSHSVLSRLIR